MFLSVTNKTSIKTSMVKENTKPAFQRDYMLKYRWKKSIEKTTLNYS